MGRSLTDPWTSAIGLAALLILTVSCDITGGCNDTILSESRSPNGQLVVTIFARDCGATTASNIQASLRSRSMPFDRRKAQSFLVLENVTNLTVSWLDDSTLTVSLPRNATIFRKEEKQNAVTIRYAEKNE